MCGASRTETEPSSWRLRLEDVSVEVRANIRALQDQRPWANLVALLAGTSATEFYPLLLSAIIMGYLYWKASEFEEKKFSESQLADQYARYKARTGRFFPRVWAREVHGCSERQVHVASVASQDP